MLITSLSIFFTNDCVHCKKCDSNSLGSRTAKNHLNVSLPGIPFERFKNLEKKYFLASPKRDTSSQVSILQIEDF
jgi:hypothetical protein